MKLIFNTSLLFFVFITFIPVFSQAQVHIEGTVRDESGNPLNFVNITVPGTVYGTSSGQNGTFSFSLPEADSVKILFSFVGFRPKLIKRTVREGEMLKLDIKLEIKVSELVEVEVTGQREDEQGFVQLRMKELKTIPTVSGSVESYLKTLPGVSSANELSSMYSVRGGNFDENLIYINDIEVYRPFLIRAGKQEGLSIVNSDLASSVKFSAGGFSASYGDKMSSVLDIRYRKPIRFGGGFQLSLLGASVYLEGISKNQRLTWLAGARYKTNQYLLKTLDVKGDYKPRFGDIQTYITYKLSEKWDLDFLGNLSINHYNFIPEDRTTSFGTLVNAVQLYVLFNGQETDRFNTYLGALTATYHHSDNLSLKFYGSAYRTTEEENYDIEGFYSLNELDKQIGSESFGDSIMNIGIGRFIDHARNYFSANVISISHTGDFRISGSSIKWGLKLQNEHIRDRMNEWKMVDSAGYSIPYDGQTVNMAYYIYANNNLSTNRFTSYLLYSRRFEIKSVQLNMDAGLRTHFWDFNRQFLVSPRISLQIDPDWEKNITFHVATGFYYQPPFYKEIKDRNGDINYDIRAQRSIHYLLGSVINFRAWNRPFKFTTEVYYKSLNYLIPYKINNVRIIYSAKNNARGYASGIEFKINGDFVKGAESWASLSLMQTREKIIDSHDPEGNGSTGYYPRPTDQLVNFSLFFQDYFPSNPTFKVFMTLHYGSGLPVSSPYTDSNENYFRMPSYKRVDIGLSKVIKDESSIIGDKGLFRNFRSAWISLEVFNLLGINNTISYTWITTVNNLNGQVGQFAVPNYLTSRRINLKLTASF